jgi:hypothetical protein
MPAPEWIRSMLATTVEWIRSTFAASVEWNQYIRHELIRPIIRPIYILFGLFSLFKGAQNYLQQKDEIRFLYVRRQSALDNDEVRDSVDALRYSLIAGIILTAVGGGLLIIAAVLSPRALTFILVLPVSIFEFIDAVSPPVKPRRTVLWGTLIVLTVIAWTRP